MFSRPVVPIVVACLALAGCAADGTATRQDFSPVETATLSQAVSPGEARLLSQTRALEEMAADMVRTATLKGAGIGAAAGCGAALISAQSASRCLGGAVVGGLVGAAVGHNAGERQLQRQLAGLSRDDLAQSLSRAHARLGTVQAGLSAVLADQAAERADLMRNRAAGTLSQAEYDRRIGAMEQARRDIALALTNTAAQGETLISQIANLRAKGADGLEWHSQQAKEFAADVVSARAKLSLI